VETPRGRFVATFYTLREIERLMDMALSEGRTLEGKYFADPSMVIVRALNEAGICEAVADLVASEPMCRVFEPCRHVAYDAPGAA
jgi:hypothetical protein